MISSASDWIHSQELIQALTSGELEVEGRLIGASNGALRCVVPINSVYSVRCVYKPVAGERPLWDFPEDTLSKREVASYEMSEALGLHVVPPTVWRTKGPAGPGMCQVWIDEVAEMQLVAVLPGGEDLTNWHHVFDGSDEYGGVVSLVHARDATLQKVALLDAVINNADRKGGHLLVDENQRIWAIDHGVSFSTEEKLRTVLWGWAGESIPDDLAAPVAALREMLSTRIPESVTAWLSTDEVESLEIRIKGLLADGTFPVPSADWPAIPWPVF
jgi:uncharacterized repeat protein (TIGR03843 family)